jgi:N-methylhydantoinase A
LVQVGPDSAGAVPGPACYGQGGREPTVTDADLVLGYLAADRFLGGDMRLDVAAARAAIGTHIAEPLGLGITEAAWGIHETVNEAMSQAAGMHVLEKGRRAADFAMLPIGGAGPVHACHVAQRIGMRRVICPPGAGVASAFGFLAAPMAFEFVQAGIQALDALDIPVVRTRLAALEAQGRALLHHAAVDTATLDVAIGCAMRYVGQGYEVEVPVDPRAWAEGDRGALAARFALEYRALYGRVEAAMPVEIVSWRVIVSGKRPDLKLTRRALGAHDAEAARTGMRPVFDSGLRQFRDTAVFDRTRFLPGMQARGPAVVEERESTLVVPSGAWLRCDGHGNLIVEFDA